jgi:hypothetical protein
VKLWETDKETRLTNKNWQSIFLFPTKLSSLFFSRETKGKWGRRDYRSFESEAAFLLVDAIGGFRDPNPREIGSEQFHRVYHVSLQNQKGFEQRQKVRVREREREREREKAPSCPKLMQSLFVIVKATVESRFLGVSNKSSSSV